MPFQVTTYWKSPGFELALLHRGFSSIREADEFARSIESLYLNEDCLWLSLSDGNRLDMDVELDLRVLADEGCPVADPRDRRELCFTDLIEGVQAPTHMSFTAHRVREYPHEHAPISRRAVGQLGEHHAVRNSHMRSI